MIPEIKGFTPGPWKRIKFQNGNEGFKIVAGKKDWAEQVATANEIYMDREARNANALLISHAPEMYAEIQELRAENLRLRGLIEKAVEVGWEAGFAQKGIKETIELFDQKHNL